MKVLLDTCVLAEVQHAKGSAAVKAAFARLPEEAIYLSVLNVGEIAKGIALLPASKRKLLLAEWLSGLEAKFADRILRIDREIASAWGELTAKASRQGIAVPAVDGLLAATAIVHGLQLMTRNTRHFKATGVRLIDPWADSSS